MGLWQIKSRTNDKTHGNFLSTLVSSTGCMCDQTQPPRRLTKLTQTWKTERSILPPTPPSCPRPPPPLLLAPLQGVVERWKENGNQTGKSRLTCLDLRWGKEGGGYFISLLFRHLSVGGAEYEQAEDVELSWNIRGVRWRRQSQHHPAVGPLIVPSLTTLRKTITSFKSCLHNLTMTSASGAGGEERGLQILNRWINCGL